MIRIFRYSSCSQSFIMIDGRDVEIPRFRNAGTVSAMCVMNEVDGIVIIDRSESADFSLSFRSRSGSTVLPGSSDLADAGVSSCAVAFADLLGIKAFHTREYRFEWGGVLFEAYISSHLGEVKEISINGAATVSALCEGLID